MEAMQTFYAAASLVQLTLYFEGNVWLQRSEKEADLFQAVILQ
jgi:hypothetical protein